MLKSILTFFFPKTIASIKKDALDKYFADEDRRYFESDEELWREIHEYEERMRLEYEQLNQSEL